MYLEPSTPRHQLNSEIQMDLVESALFYQNGLQTTLDKTSQELRMLSSVTLNWQVTKIVMNSGSQLSEM